MKRLLEILALLAAMALPGFAQQRLSPSDQHEFDKYYTKWVNDTRKNDRDDIAKDVKHMQEIMARNNIPANVPYDQVASSGTGYSARDYQNRLPAADQHDFDKYYTKWVNDRRKNDRDDIEKDERHMQEIMARNNIPADVPFDQVASTGNPDSYSGGGYTQNAPQSAYPPSGYQGAGSWQGRLSSEDQRDFDQYYSRWMDASRRNDRSEIAKDADRMQDIMMRNHIPSSVPFDQIASSGGNYPSNGYPSDNPNRYQQNSNGYPSDRGNAYPANGQSRMSPDDQREFDKYYMKWVDDSRKNDRDDIEKDTRHMQDIMARYNIPSDIPYDQIASPDATSRH